MEYCGFAGGSANCLCQAAVFEGKLRATSREALWPQITLGSKRMHSQYAKQNSRPLHGLPLTAGSGCPAAHALALPQEQGMLTRGHRTLFNATESRHCSVVQRGKHATAVPLSTGSKQQPRHDRQKGRSSRLLVSAVWQTVQQQHNHTEGKGTRQYSP